MSLEALKAEYAALTEQKKTLTKAVSDAKALCAHLKKSKLAKGAPAFKSSKKQAEAKKAKKQEKKQKKKEKVKEAKAANGTVLYSSAGDKSPSTFSSTLFPKGKAPPSKIATSPRSNPELGAYATSENTPSATPKHNDNNWWGQSSYDNNFDIDDLEAELECNDSKVVITTSEVPRSLEFSEKKKNRKISSLDANSPLFVPKSAQNEPPEVSLGGYESTSPHMSPAMTPAAAPIFREKPRARGELSKDEVAQVDQFVDNGDEFAAANKRVKALKWYTSALLICYDPWIFFKRGVVNRDEGNYLSRSKFPTLAQEGAALLRKSVNDFNVVMKELPKKSPEYQAALLYRAEAFHKRGLTDVALADATLYGKLSGMKSNNLCPDIDPVALLAKIKEDGRS